LLDDKKIYDMYTGTDCCSLESSRRIP